VTQCDTHNESAKFFASLKTSAILLSVQKKNRAEEVYFLGIAFLQKKTA